MKRILVIISLLFVATFTSAQYNYYLLNIGATVGLGKPYADVNKGKFLPSYSGNISYNITPFLSAGVEYQQGILTAGDPFLDPHKRYFKNEYKTFKAIGRVELGQFIDFENNSLLTALRGAYGAVGLGAIYNNQVEIVREKVNPDGNYYTFPGKDRGLDLLLSNDIGIGYILKDRWGYNRCWLFFNYQFNITFGEGLDGYNDVVLRQKQGWPDIYGVPSFGIRYSFGPEGFY